MPLGRSLQTQGDDSPTVRAELVEAGALPLARPSAQHAFAEGGSRDVAPAGESLSFASPKERNQRKGDPTGCVPPLRYGQPAVLAIGVRCGTRFALRAPLGQPQRVSSRSLCVLRRTGHPARCAPRRILKGTRGADIHTGHCCAALRSAWLSQRVALAPAKGGPSAAMARRAVRLSHPCWLRLRRGGCGVARAP